MKNSVGILVILMMFSSCFCAKGLPIKQTEYQDQEQNQKTSVDHNAWDKLLKKYVADNGDVNYKGFKNDAVALNTYINYLATQVPTESWNKQEQLAYFINVYNANTIKLIIDHYPTKSIKNIKNPWLKNRIKIGDKDFSLSGIENGILRKMNEPRIHFAINCASVSCPKLLNTAFTASNVESLMEEATKAFIQNSNNNKISKNRIELSKIFQWYKGDFKDNGSLIDYVNQYSSIKINPDAKVDYLEYDWNLNEQN
ncbi:DUF547 domain-containing protein [Geojedonia litorea]|uniref:DUF547 domain-containing protein n=1 Tax=Geojedonia litorea TaxID=1268269 RepID=A0ABV9N689_9FLAO